MNGKNVNLSSPYSHQMMKGVFMICPTHPPLSKAILLCGLFLFSARSLAQTEDRTIGAPNTFLQEIGEINDLLKYYNTLSPFSEDEKEVDQIDSLNQLLLNRLLNVLSDRRIVEYPIEKLFPGVGVAISKSEDNRLFFLSIDEKTGGSYRTQISIMHYRFPDGTVLSEYFGEETYGPIFLLDSLRQHYIVLGSVQTCGTCLAASACTIQFDSGAYLRNPIAQYDGRYGDLKVFEYDNTKKELCLEYDEADYDDPIYGGNTEVASRRKFKRTYKYADGAFQELQPRR
jgi:hypothetical protein